MLETQQYAAYWDLAVSLLRETLGAEVLRVYWMDGEQNESDRIFQDGAISPAMAQEIGQWEDDLSHGAGTLALGETSNPAERLILGAMVGAEASSESNGPLLLHLYLAHESLLYGGLTAIFGAGKPFRFDDPDLQGLVVLADLLTNNYVRSHNLDTARHRLESANLLYQFNQEVTSLDLDQVLWRSAELVAYMLDAEVSAIFLADAKKQQLTFMVATGDLGHQLIGTHVSMNTGIPGWVTSHGQPLIVNEPSQDPRFTGKLDRATGFVTQNMLCVPLILQNRPIGAMLVLNRMDGFRQQDLEWLTSVSGQIAIAVENARLYRREHTKVRELAILNQVGRAINSELDVREVIRAITDSVLEILDVERSELLLINQQRQQLELYSATGEEINSQWSHSPIRLGEGLVGWCTQNMQALVVNRVGNDPRCVDMFVGSSMDDSSLAVVPLFSRGAPMGAIVAYSVLGHPFDEERMSLLQNFANQAAVALENAALFQNLQREQERIITIQEEVRHQLARDLHDGPAQMLSSIIMSIDLTRRYVQRDQDESVLNELDRLEEIARQANREVRTLLFELRPIILESRGLVPALQAYHRQLTGTISSRVHLEVAPFSETFSPRSSSSIFAIIQESVNNIRKHAKAQNIWIRIYVEEESLIFEVEDDGVGMDLGRLSDDYVGRNSFGLLNMRERATLLGGKLIMRSPRAPGLSGTTVVGTLPLRAILGEPDPDFSPF